MSSIKKYLLAVLFGLFMFTGFSQTHLYENPNFHSIARDHKTIGIIPFKASVTLRPKQMREITSEQLARLEKAEGESIQAGMYSWLLKRQKRGTLTVNVQDLATTNAKLRKAEITIENYEDYTPTELANIIGVDAIIMGTYKTNKPGGAALDLGVLVGFYGGLTNEAVLNFFIYNAKDGELLINYNKSISGSIGSSSEGLINVLMKKVSRRIAYTR